MHSIRMGYNLMTAISIVGLIAGILAAAYLFAGLAGQLS
jgi:hypothetical protein